MIARDIPYDWPYFNRIASWPSTVGERLVIRMVQVESIMLVALLSDILDKAAHNPTCTILVLIGTVL